MQRTIRPPEPAWLDVRAVADRFGVTIATIWAWARERKEAFPSPVRLTAGTSRWRLSDLEAWEADRQAQSGNSRREFDELRRRDVQKALKAMSATISVEASKASGSEVVNGRGR